MIKTMTSRKVLPAHGDGGLSRFGLAVSCDMYLISGDQLAIGRRNVVHGYGCREDAGTAVALTGLTCVHCQGRNQSSGMRIAVNPVRTGLLPGAEWQ